MTLNPHSMARYLTVALNQRKRELAKMQNNYGNDSPVTNQIATEISELQLEINEFLKLAAKAPLRK